MDNKGFTLVELIGVVLILIILIMYAVPKVSKLYKNSKKNPHFHRLTAFH